MTRMLALSMALLGCTVAEPPTEGSPAATLGGGLELSSSTEDCAETDCTEAESAGPEVCGNGRDDDGDGAVDCQDSDCDGGCPEDCVDDRDNDGDSAVDCQDADCDGGCPEDCVDGRDNDGDGAVDCQDADCDGGCPEDCSDERDNDGDALPDCRDPDCDGVCPESCSDERDNDGDGLVDLDDPDCDQDGDGWAPPFDCDDTDASRSPDMEEVCEDGIDQDCDGFDAPCLSLVGTYTLDEGPTIFGADLHGGLLGMGIEVQNCVETCAALFGGEMRDWVCSVSPYRPDGGAYYAHWDSGCVVRDDDDSMGGCVMYDIDRDCILTAWGRPVRPFTGPEYCGLAQVNHCWERH